MNTRIQIRTLLVVKFRQGECRRMTKAVERPRRRYIVAFEVRYVVIDTDAGRKIAIELWWDPKRQKPKRDFNITSYHRSRFSSRDIDKITPYEV